MINGHLLIINIQKLIVIVNNFNHYLSFFHYIFITFKINEKILITYF